MLRFDIGPGGGGGGGGVQGTPFNFTMNLFQTNRDEFKALFQTINVKIGILFQTFMSKKHYKHYYSGPNITDLYVQSPWYN